MRHFAFLAFLVFVGLPAFAAAQDARFDAAVEDHPDFSGVIVIAEKGRVIYQRAAGYRDFTTRTPMTVDTIFELASLSKQFTAMAVMVLKEEGRLTFDDPVENFLPDFPYPGITIRHLLNHTSGMPDYQDLMREHWDKTKVAGNAEILDVLRRHAPKPLSAPGEKYEYSNAGYLVLGSIVEDVAAQNFADVLQNRIFTPLHMTDTALRGPEDWTRLERFALGHEYDIGAARFIRSIDQAEPVHSIYTARRVGPGRVSSTAADLLKWDRALYANAMVSPATMSEAFSPAKLNDGSLSPYGFGWRLDPHDKLGARVWHTGRNPGFSTRMLRFVDTDKTVIVLSNNAYADIDILLESLLTALSGKGS